MNDNHIDIYATQNEGKSDIVEKVFRTLRNKIYMHIAAASKNVYIDKLYNIVDKYNNKYHRTNKITINAKLGACTKCIIDSSVNHSKFKTGNHAFADYYTPN